MGAHLKNLQTAFREVFANAPYIVLASTLAILTFLFAVWLPNLGLLQKILATSSTPLADAAKVAFGLLGGIGTNFSALSAGYTLAIAALFGVNTALVVFFLRHRRTLPAKKEMAAGLGGIASGAFGVGCAACGSFLLSAALSFFGAGSAIALLPLRGGEFGILSVLLLLVSLALLSKSIAASACDS